MRAPSTEAMLEREAVANRPKHWVRLVTACNSRCIFCLDSDTPRNVYLPEDEVKAELRRGREEFGAWKVILSGGEGSLHPKFAEFCAYAREIGYGRVQTVTNGWRFAEKDFFEAAVGAGLDEITFSLHGHDEALHDRMTQHPGSYRNIVKAIARSIRSRRVITSIDVCINKQNVPFLDKIVELGFSLGVTEYDLLHVIPQAAAFDNRDELFYDPREHLPMLHKVFRLNRHPSFVIWTNRFPVNYLEGLEDLIQDPHKMLDEVNGRRYQVRRYLDTGEALDCRQPERCVHCFIEPFCTTTDRVVQAQREGAVEVWDLGRVSPEDSHAELPFGASLTGVDVDSVADTVDLAPARGLFVRSHDASSLDALAQRPRSVLVVTQGAQLDAWLPELPSHLELDVELSRDTAESIATHALALQALGARARIHQPAHEHLADTVERDVRDPRAFFARIQNETGASLRVSGLPACLAPGMQLAAERTRLSRTLFEQSSGRLDIHELARHHVRDHYRGKSIRCADCVAHARCDGAHINLIRDQGLAMLTPLTTGPEAEHADAQTRRLHPEPISRLANARPLEAVAPSLPGFAMPQGAAADPLALIAVEQMVRRAKKDELKARAAAGRGPSDVALPEGGE